ncbi:vWA domain-containing protein [Actinopolymorpha pittospori]|uniref:VWFA domain-containing protein n=1 Tax=Actinopolymorpha pittospori TaxID=648752 RepID=A0A927MUU1_9ACTN|nr:vWA domain-containing protein [Actinopolymorpha pittospori]MBE1603715.1 hypothetical protein [Actinopolymorpha pittospori]
MPYNAEISRNNPACFIFLVDQSASMSDPIGGEFPQKKADVVADAINRLLIELSVRCAKEEGVRDYFHVGVIGYGTTVGSAFAGDLAGRDLVPLSEVADNPARLEDRQKKVPDGAGGLVESTTKFAIWMEPTANGGTPMTRALKYAETLVSDWVQRHPEGYPPIVLNLTDGESTDGDPAPAAIAVTGHATSDGATLLFNLHVSAAGGSPIIYPDSDAELPDTYARALFAMSSILPSQVRAYAASEGRRVGSEARGLIYNADAATVVQFLEVGTRASELR